VRSVKSTKYVILEKRLGQQWNFTWFIGAFVLQQKKYWGNFKAQYFRKIWWRKLDMENCVIK